MILAILNLCLTVIPPSFSLIRLTVWEEMSFEDHGSHLGYRNGTILAIQNLHAATMPPTRFPLNQTYLSGDA